MKLIYLVIFSSAIILVSARDAVSTAFDEVSASKNVELPVRDAQRDLTDNQDKRHNSNNNWLGLSFYISKCKPNEYKLKSKLEDLKLQKEKCEADVGIRANKLTKCESDYEIAEAKEKELIKTLDTCSADLKTMKLTLSTDRANVAKCEASQDKLLRQEADLREANALIKADNRVLIRDLEECDENEEHCSENLEECNFRCNGNNGGGGSSSSSSGNSGGNGYGNGGR